jgi:hypothetical protein
MLTTDVIIGYLMAKAIFARSKHPRRYTKVEYRLSLAGQADDYDLFCQIRDHIGGGQVYYRPKKGAAGQALMTTANKQILLEMVKGPLNGLADMPGRKARDYIVWRDALLLEPPPTPRQRGGRKPKATPKNCSGRRD